MESKLDQRNTQEGKQKSGKVNGLEDPMLSNRGVRNTP